MEINTYLFFNGTCAEAFGFYEKTLGGRIVVMMTHRESPAADSVPAEWQDKIIHARLEFGNRVLMASDAPPGQFSQPQGFAVQLHVDTPAEAERLYKALSENGTIRMPMQETFFAARFGMFVDRFGTPWMVYCDPQK